MDRVPLRSVFGQSVDKEKSQATTAVASFDEAEPSLEENSIPSSITNVPDEVLGGMSQSFYFSSSYRDLE